MVVAASHHAGHPINTRPAIMAAILVMGVIYNLLWPNDIVHSVIERDIPGLPTGSSPQHTRRCTRFSTELSSVLSPGFSTACPPGCQPVVPSLRGAKRR